MSEEKTNPRRQFLKNTSLAALSLGLLSFKAKAEPPAKVDDGCFPSTVDYYGEGPFYTENPPDIIDGQLAASDEPGTRMIISGRVQNLDCTEFLEGTVIDIWHANDAGQYDNVGYNLRGKTYANSQGFYLFETVHPGKYLNGSSYRPSHIHFKITPPGFETLTTQLYFAGDPYIDGDAAASITEGVFDATHRIIPLTTNNDGKEEGTWDIVVDGDGTVGVNNIHVDKGMIYATNPNPFTDKLYINYGIFREANISLLVFNLQGQMVATLEERRLTSGKYTAEWKPQSELPGGIYFVALKINEMQVHYQKVVLRK
ncbi:MAG TPA: T9SS type A sorting domain-containing protein [Bacteroidales bacterium]